MLDSSQSIVGATVVSGELLVSCSLSKTSVICFVVSSESCNSVIAAIDEIDVEKFVVVVVVEVVVEVDVVLVVVVFAQ